MISRVEALGYRCLRYVKQDLLPFQVLVGPNGSGKSTFLDVFDFVSDVVCRGPREAVWARAPDVRDLVSMRQGDHFELVVEVDLPEPQRARLKTGGHTGARYEISVGAHPQTEELGILAETLWLTKEHEPPPEIETKRDLFPESLNPPNSIIQARAPLGWKKVVNKVADSGNDYFSSETSGWNNLFRLGPQKSALANLPEDETKFPIATWFKEGLAYEAWTFVASPAVEHCLGWESPSRLRRWLRERGLWGADQPKPAAPKESMEAALREVAKPRSSSIYECLGRLVEFHECADPAFRKFRETLAQWFPAHQPT